MRLLNRPHVEWIWYLLWALFVNACNFWLITPLVEDYAMLGVVAVFVLSAVWVLSIPRTVRRKWISFTLFSLLLGQGMSSVSVFEWSMRVKWGLLLSLGLILLVWLFARVRLLTSVLSAAGLIIANLLLPMSAWPFLTHFTVAYSAVKSLTPSDMPALPIA
ncbi:MAG: hypothetical protein K6T83_14170, partial [Alicyclobacillus sp.]|nr:hypothetical protein [Alicyclobacillus sp.]